MAERVVIASLDMDDIPVAAKSKRVQAEFLSMERGTTALMRRMFDLRLAVTAMLGAFTVAGAVRSLQQLGAAALKTQDNFKQLQAASGALHKEVVNLTASILGAKGLNSAMTQWELRLAAIARTANDVISHTEDEGLISKMLFGAAKAGFGPGKLLLALEQIGARLDDIFAKQKAAITPLPPAQRIGLAEWLAALANQPLGVAREIRTPLAERVDDRLFRRILDINQPLQDAYEITERIAGSVEKVSDGWEEVANSLLRIHETDLAPDFETAMLQVNNLRAAFASMEADVALIEAAAYGFANALSAGFAGGALSFRKMIGQILEAIAAQLFALGAVALVEAYLFPALAASRLKAAAIAFAGGAAAATAARHFGGGEAAGGGGAPASAAAPSGGQVQNIAIYVQGDFVGSEENIRALTVSVQQALRDGANGGSFN